MVFTFYTYIMNFYISFYMFCLISYSVYCSLFLLLFFIAYNIGVNYFLESWVVFLNYYHSGYIKTQMSNNYITINFFKQPLLVATIIKCVFLNNLCDYFYIFSFLVTKSYSYKQYRDKKIVRSINYKFLSKYIFTNVHFNINQIYNFIKKIILSLILSLIYLIYTIYFFQIQFLKQLSIWFIIGIIFYWLISGFNFFIKHYQFGKFTSQIQRFWKRTNTYFWLIEGFLILLFFYYFLNSSQEPLYMYDYSSINQEYLVSLTSIYSSLVILSFIIYLMYTTLLLLNYTTWAQQSVYLLIITVFVFFTFFIETYQFYYLLNSFSEKIWFFNEELNIWLLTQDNPIIRCKHYYLMIYLIAKYWHFLFIFLSWVFFMAKNIEKRSTNYVLFGANLQNLILLFILNISCYAQWLKWFYRRFYDMPYKWFFINSSYNSYTTIVKECASIFSELFGIKYPLITYTNICFKSLFLWNVDSIFLWNN